MKYKQIVFDVDGTLLNTESAILHSLQDTMRTISGETIPLEKLTFSLGITGEDALQILGVKDIAATMDLWNKKLRDYTDDMAVFDGMEELLESLLEQGCEMGIITSRTKEEFEYGFGQFDIKRYFKTIVCADDTKEHKPNAAPLSKYMELTGTDSEQVLYIGDSEYDSQCAENAGTDFALAGWGARNKMIKASYYLEKPAELLPIITRDTSF
ncbi:MAG: HAD family hydrolase [Lachnospiraceae bacterium]|nr:HAD family hydrolase [Lachnospiraceae bacterium]